MNPSPSKTASKLALLAACWLPLACSEQEPPLIALSELSTACIVSAACGVESRPSVSLCLENYFGRLVPGGKGGLYGEMYRCALAKGGDCEAVRNCFGARASCTRESFKGSCEGATAVECDLIDGRVYARACGTVGLGCSPSTEQAFAANCVCDSAYGTRCAGGVALRCSGNQVVGENCALAGQTCSEGQCIAKFAAESCGRDFKPSCDGSLALTCSASGELRRTDCAADPVRSRCQAGTCVAQATECGEDFNRCTADGGLEACIDGRWQRFECLGLGLQACKAGTYGANCSDKLRTQ